MAQTLPLAGGPTPVSRHMLEFWRGQQGEDSSLQIVIRAGDTTVHADRTVLMGWSKFFRTKFNSEFEDAETGEVNLEDSYGPALLPLVEGLYSHEVAITPECVEGLVVLADRLQITEITGACITYMLTTAKKDIESTIAMARQCGLGHVQQEIMQGMLPRLQRRSELISAEVIAMLADSQIMQLVSADDLVVESEMAVVNILETRVQACGRVPPEAYEAVRFEHMTTEELSELIIKKTPLLKHALWALVRMAGNAPSSAPFTSSRTRRCTAPEYMIWRVYDMKAATLNGKTVRSPRYRPRGFNNSWVLSVWKTDSNEFYLGLSPLHKTGVAHVGVGAGIKLENPETGASRHLGMGPKPHEGIKLGERLIWILDEERVSVLGDTFNAVLCLGDPTSRLTE